MKLAARTPLRHAADVSFHLRLVAQACQQVEHRAPDAQARRAAAQIKREAAELRRRARQLEEALTR